MNYDLDSAIVLLARTPAVMRELLEGLPSQWLDAPEREGAWSPRDVACHVADLERDGWLPRLRTILDFGRQVPLPGIDRERFRTRYGDTPIRLVLEDFDRLRTENLEALRRIDPDAIDLERLGRHAVLGEVRLSELLAAWVVHDLTHIAQIARAQAAQYREAVGPWKNFLSVLASPS